jgi:hypothetical protein
MSAALYMWHKKEKLATYPKYLWAFPRILWAFFRVAQWLVRHLYDWPFVVFWGHMIKHRSRRAAPSQNECLLRQRQEQEFIANIVVFVGCCVPRTRNILRK